MEVDQLTDEQIANLTPEQIDMLEIDPSKLSEILGNANDHQEATTRSGGEPEQEGQDSAANGAGETEEKADPVVLNKSGKGVIPYEKHKELRVENANLREQLQGLQKAQTELETLRKQQAQTKSPERRAEIQKKLVDGITRMKEDFPDIGDSLDSVNELLTDMAQELAEEKAANKARKEELEAEKQRVADEQKRTIEEQVQEAKENNPDLIYWEQNDQTAWTEAMMQDQALLQIPKWANKPIEERFAEVVKRVRTIMPEATEPPNASPSAKTQAKAKEKLEKATVRKPTTLSDIQGGAQPASEREQVENLSGHELTRRLMNMPAHVAAAMRAELD